MSLTCVVPRVWRIAAAALAVLMPLTAGFAGETIYTVDRFELVWKQLGPDLPSLNDLRRTPTALGRTARGYAVKVPGAPGVRTDLAALDRQGLVRIDASAIESLATEIQRELAQGGLLGGTVKAFLQQESSGKNSRYAVWLIAELPLPGLSPNVGIPSNLIPLRQSATPATMVSGIELRWEGDMQYLPSTRAFLDSLELPVAIRGEKVTAEPGGHAELGRLRYEPGLRWSPAAIDALTEGIRQATDSLGADVWAVVSTDTKPAAAGGVVLEYIVTVMSREGADTSTVSDGRIAAPQPLVPDVPLRATIPPSSTIEASIEEESVPKPLDRPALAPQIDGVSIHWAEGVTGRGNPETPFELTTVRLRLVDGDVQAGWGDTGELSSLVTDLATFPSRPWRPSATRAVRHAVEDRLAELGMSGTLVTDAIETIGDRSVLAIRLHPPPRDVDFPALAEQDHASGDTYYYVVWPFDVMYSLDHSELPPAASFEHLPLELGVDSTGFVPPNGGNTIQTTLGQLNDGGPMLYEQTALLAIERAIVAYLTSQDLMGVTVQPLAGQISGGGETPGRDLRDGGTELTLVTTVARVAEIQTSASGDRIPDEDRMNHPAHRRIAEGSPLAAAEDGGEGDLIKRGQVEDYLHRLSRHPGRDIRWTGSMGTLVGPDSDGPMDWSTEMAPFDVEAPVAAEAFDSDTVSPLPGGVTLDYMVSEAKPWTIWYEYGNTGTKAEGYMRQRLGYYTSQLTDNDDILSFQYVTSNFSDTNAVLGSYEAPLGLDGRLRWGVNGSWSQYFADQFGVVAIPNAFTGFSWSGGAELRLNAYQDGPLFVDVVGGGRLQHLGIENNILFWMGQEEASFAIPYGMLQVERDGEWSSLRASVGVEGNVLSHDDAQLARLGVVTNRPNIANLWARLNWSGSFSAYLEPLFNYDAWSDPSTAGSSTLAHEAFLGVSGQFAFGNRLMPQFQAVAGGPGTNRGYPVSIAAGDNVVNLTGEYRFHVPRALSLQPQPSTLFGEPFRVAPQRPYGRADWDLMLLGFVDYSWLTKNDKIAVIGETDQTLLSAGVGLEFQFKRNLRVRLDWGWALRSLEGGLYDSGHDRLYVQASLSF